LLEPTRTARSRASEGSAAILSTPLSPPIRGAFVKRTGDGSIIEFRSVVDAVRCAIEVQNGLMERNAGVPEDRRIQFRVGIHVGDVVEESDGDLMGDAVNIAARLEGVAKPAAICLSEQAYWQVKGRLDLKVTDLGATQLKNIAEPVHVYSVEVGKPAEATPASPASRGKPGPPRLSIVVLPFANIGGDPEQDYFVDGVTESLTTDLSRISGAFVIGRSTAFTYKGKAVDLKQIGRDLNVRYVLEGSVQRGGNRMRVNVQLIDAETGAHLWGERFDKAVADLFDMQDEIVGRLADQLQAALVDVEARRAEQSPNCDSMDFYFQGRAMLNRGLSPDLLANARGFFQRAMELDRSNVDALVGVAAVDMLDAWSYRIDDPRPLWAAAETKASQASAAAPNHPRAHQVMGAVLSATNRAARGIVELERALVIDPNFARARGTMGLAHVYLGRAEETEAHVLEALRLSPRDPLVSGWFLHVGSAKSFLGEYEAAVAWLRKSIDANRNNPWAYFYLAACLAHLGRVDEARDEVKAGLSVNPKFTIRHFLAARESDNPVFVVQHKRVVEGLRKAGVPEG
jgi:TolB-like protein